MFYKIGVAEVFALAICVYRDFGTVPEVFNQTKNITYETLVACNEQRATLPL